MKVAGIETVPFWEICNQDVLLTRIKRLTWAQRYCRGRAEDIHTHVEQHVEFLKDVYLKRFVKQGGKDGSNDH